MEDVVAEVMNHFDVIRDSWEGNQFKKAVMAIYIYTKPTTTNELIALLSPIWNNGYSAACNDGFDSGDHA